MQKDKNKISFKCPFPCSCYRNNTHSGGLSVREILLSLQTHDCLMAKEGTVPAICRLLPKADAAGAGKPGGQPSGAE